MREEVIFNGIRLSDYFDIIDVKRPNAAVASETMAVSGRDGLVLTGSSLGTVTISVIIMLRDSEVSGRRARMREVQVLLNTKEPAPLEFSEDEGLYYMAKLDGEMPVREHVRSGGIEVNFTAFDPILYGRRRSVTVPSGGSVTFIVGGSYKTRPRISGSVKGANQTGNLWGIRLDDRYSMRIPMGGTATKPLDIDCKDRICRVNSVITLPTMQSDWFALEAGQHVIENDMGSGAVTVTWNERWR